MSSDEENEQNILEEMVKLEHSMKQHGPNMFVSGWDDPEDLVDEEKDPHSTPEKELLWAAGENHLDMVKRVLKIHPELVNIADEDGYSPLHKACYNNNYEMAKLLLQYNANPNALTEYKWTPLHSACKWNSTKCVALLLQHGANINALSDGDQTPLHIASTVSKSRDTLFTLLMHQRVNPNLKNNSQEVAADIAKRTGPSLALFDIGHSALEDVETGLI